MRIFFSFLLLVFITSSCSKKEQEELSYIIQYQTQTVTPEIFLKKLIIQSHIKYKELRTEKLKDPAKLETLKKETLALLIQEIFVNDLANKHSIVILDDELKKWISERSKGTRTENLNLFLNANGLKENDWNRMFKNQLLMHKVKNFLKLADKDQTKTDKKSNDKQRKDLKTQVQIGVISYDDKHEAETAYTRIRRGQNKFQTLLKKKTGSDKFQWLIEEDLPFKDKTKKLRIKRVSKVMQTEWGYSLIFINKREKRAVRGEANNAISQSESKWSQALKDFKENEDLKINFDLFYGLKLKR